MYSLELRNGKACPYAACTTISSTPLQRYVYFIVCYKKLYIVSLMSKQSKVMSVADIKYNEKILINHNEINRKKISFVLSTDKKKVSILYKQKL